MTPDLRPLTDLCATLTGHQPQSIVALPASASDRRYYRIDGMIGVVGSDRRENHAFVTMAHHLRAQGINVPEVYAVAPDEGCYVQQDLGSTSLFDRVAACHARGWDDDTLRLLEGVMHDLVDIQFAAWQTYDFDRDCARYPRFDRVSVMWDLNYFKYCFLKPSGIAHDEWALEQDFGRLAERLTDVPAETFLYRDFQSRNVMVGEGRPAYIDFQGGMLGPIYYDVASFVWQARAAYPPEVKERLIDAYCTALSSHRAEPKPVFRQRLRLFVHFRLLQVLGAYGFRGLYERKALFLSPIHQALRSVAELLDTDAELADLTPALTDALHQAERLPRFQPAPTDGPLVVRVTSFSYKKGIPDDLTGNGGGFVFDCRAPHNPGRYAEYKRLTGLDTEVIDMLDGRDRTHDDALLGTEPTMPQFMEHVYGLVDPAVATYARRGFTSLMVSFGCTGGQHRSVYAAQHMADHLRQKFPMVRVELRHRELQRDDA